MRIAKNIQKRSRRDALKFRVRNSAEAANRKKETALVLVVIMHFAAKLYF